MEESAYTVGPMTDDPELVEQFDGHVEGADASAVYASASRSFLEARELLSRIESASGYSLFVGIGASDLAQPSIDRKLAKSRGKGKHRLYAQSLVRRCPRSVRPKLARVVVDHTTLLCFVLIRACCVAKLGIVHQNVPTKDKRLHSHLESVHLVPMLWAVLCSMPFVVVPLSKKPKKIRT